MRPITAADLMNPHVLTVREDLTVQELASFLLRHQITGAPVEDARGHLVGVVSVSDIAEASLAEGSDSRDSGDAGDAGGGGDGGDGDAGDRDAAGGSLHHPLRQEVRPGVAVERSAVRERAAAAWLERRPDSPAALAHEPDTGGAELRGQDELTVRDIMTPAVVSVAEDATVSEVASKMLDGHVHRLLVTRDGQPLGIITTSDLLGLLIDER
jgi:CBS domain-containing protein